MAAKLGDFFVNISTKADNKGIKEVSTGLDDLLGKAKKLAATYLTFRAVKGGIEVTGEIIKDAAELGRLSDTLGVATEDLEQFGRAFEIVGADAQDAYNIISKLKQLPSAIEKGYADDMAEAFGRAGISLDKLRREDPIGTFNEIRKTFNSFSADDKLLFANQLGFSEKTLRVLRQTDQEYRDLLDTAKESPLLDQEQKGVAEKYARTATRARISKDALLRNGAIAAAPALTKGAETIVNGAEFINATFSDNKKSDIKPSKLEAFGKMFSEPKTSTFVGGRLKEAFDSTSNFLNEWTGEIKKVLPKKPQIDPKEVRQKIVSERFNLPGEKTVIVNNNFSNKTDIQVQRAKDLQEDLIKNIPGLVDEVFLTTIKQSSEDFKKGVIQ